MATAEQLARLLAPREARASVALDGQTQTWAGPLSDERLAEIRARCNSVHGCPPPWKWEEVHVRTNGGWYDYDGARLLDGNGQEILVACEASGPDAEGGGWPPEFRVQRFMEAARQNIPDLLAEVERLRSRNAELVEVLRGVEWVERVDGVGRLYGHCPSCQRDEPRHAPDCALDAALRGEDGE